MKCKILAIGDVCGNAGLDILGRKLWGLRRYYGADFVVVNGENAAGSGITPAQARELFTAGADVVTLGNHGLRRREIVSFLEDEARIIRPANWPAGAPGNGATVYDTGKTRICVINLIGRVDLGFGTLNPFDTVDVLLEQYRGKADLYVVDFHAEATSEKCAMAYHLDGRVNVLFGTHTHVQTADEQILEKGTGYISDLGMTGPVRSILGTSPEDIVRKMTTHLPTRFHVPDGDCKLEGVILDLAKNGLCTGIRRVQLR